MRTLAPADVTEKPELGDFLGVLTAPAPTLGRYVTTHRPHPTNRLRDVTTVVSVGAGQDSTALLYLIGLDAKFRETWAPGRVLAIMAETGDEHEETIAHINTLEVFCAERHIDWQYLSLDRGYHRGKWASGLGGLYDANKSIGSQAFPKSCTDNLKLIPIYNFLAENFAAAYGGNAAGKQSLYFYKALFREKLRVIIGIASGEEKRIAKAELQACPACKGSGSNNDIMFSAFDQSRKRAAICKPCGGTGKQKPRSKWFADCIERVYPLAAIGWGRQECQHYIQSLGRPVPPPSLCFMCPYKSPDELLWSWLVDPLRFTEWCRLERQKLDANAEMNAVWNPRTRRHENKNYGVYKTKLLMDVVNERLAYYDGLGWSRYQTLAYVTEKRMSHGHCVASAY